MVAWTNTFFLPINHNHKSASQLCVSLGAVVVLMQTLMVIVAAEVTQLNKEQPHAVLVVRVSIVTF